MKILLADTDRLWLRSCALWLNRRGDEVRLVFNVETLNATLGADPQATALLAPQLVAELAEDARGHLAGTLRGLIWRATPPGIRGPRLGPGMSPHLPRPRTHTQLEAQLRFLQHASARDVLDLPQVGEVLGLSVRGPDATLQAFRDETAQLLFQLERTASCGELRRWQHALHAWRGCAAAMGARRLVDFPLPEAGPGPTLVGVEADLAGLRRARLQTLRLLKLATFAYRDSASS